jgi:magnesium chelatase family protein
MDRIDMHVDVRGVEFDQLRTQKNGPTSAELRARVIRARELQAQRFAGTGTFCNGSMSSSQVASFCKIDSKAEKTLATAFEKRGLSARSYDRVLKVARTLADLDDRLDIGLDHVAQALNYRQLDTVI